MVFKGGNRRTGETTTLLGDNHVLKGRNFIPDGDGVSVRSGMTAILQMDDSSNTQVPLAVKTVTISGEDIILSVMNNCKVYAIFPKRTGMYYQLYRRYYDINEPILLGNETYVPNYADIVQVGNYIYLISPTRSWVIYRDGMLKFEQTHVGYPTSTDKLIVDALDATILDLDYESIKLTKTGKTGSYIRKGDWLSARFRSEFGGRGAPSSATKVQETDSYVVEVGNSLKRFYFGKTDNSTSRYDRYYPVCYMHSNGAVQRETSTENLTEDTDNYTRNVKILKNVFTYGILVAYSITSTTVNVTIACKTGSDNHLKVGTKVGLTLPRNHYDAGNNTTWIDATIVANPGTIPDKFNDYMCLTFEYDIPIGGDLAYGPYGLFDPETYDADSDLTIHDFSGTLIMWQTVDMKKYSTAYIWTPTGEGGNADKNFYGIDQIYNSEYPVTTMYCNINNDVVYQPVTFFPSSEVRGNASSGTFNGIYSTNYYSVSQSEYNITEPGVQYARKVGEADKENYIFTENTKSLFNSNGNLDGSVIKTKWTYLEEQQYVDHITDTWFKDRWYYITAPIIKYVEGEGEGAEDKFFFAPLIVVSEPHNCTSSIATTGGRPLATYITAPSEKIGKRFPVNMNLWYQPKFHYDTDPASLEGTNQIEYNPYAIIDEKGDPIIQTRVPSYANGKSDYELDNSLIMAYWSTDCTSEDGESIYKHGYYEIYKDDIPGQSYPTKIAEDLNLLNLQIDLSVQRINKFNPADTSSYYLLHQPIYISNMQNVSSVSSNSNTRSVGEFTASAYFNGNMYFASGNTIKSTNEFLEWDSVNTFTVGGIVNQLVSLNNMLFILTDEGIYSYSTEGKIEKFSSIKASMGSVSGEKMMIVGMDGKIYHTEFSPVPISSQWQLTNNPYVIAVDDTEVIKNLQETWTVYDIASLDDKFYVATNKGVWVYHGSTKSWWEYKLPYETLRMVRYQDQIVCFGGNYVDTFILGPTKFKDISLFNGGS